MTPTRTPAIRQTVGEARPGGVTERYVAVFERIGRDHSVPDLEVTGDADAIAEAVWRYARGFLGSKQYDVDVNLETLTGVIEWGRFGRFSLRAAADGSAS